MEQYRIEGLITAQTTALTLKPAAGPELKIALSGGRNDAALFQEDRRILDVSRSPDFVTAWRLRQDDVLRARIIDRGFHSIPRSGEEFLSRLQYLWHENLNLILLGLGSGLAHRYNVYTDRGVYSVSWPPDGWEIPFFAPDNRRIGRVIRVPSGYLIEIEAGADRFLVLGMSLFVLLQYYANTIRVRDTFVRQTWIVNPIVPGRRRRRHRRERRRKWIDDPLGARNRFPRGRYGIDDPDPESDRKWIDNPIPERSPVQIDDPKPQPEPVRIDDPES